MRRSALKSIASMVGGPVTVIVGVTLTAFDFYMDNSDLNESQLMYAMATADLIGAPIELNRIYQTAQTGLSRILLQYPAMVATGRINGVSHFSDGQMQGYPIRYWIEKASYSKVSLTNTGAYETTYWVRINYLADTERFGVPWVTMDQNAFATITLAPNVTGTIRVDYLEKDGTVGLSPRSRTCVSGAGCIEPSNMQLVVLGTNEAGTYYVGSNGSAWQPTPTSPNRAGIAAIDAESPTVDPLVSTYVLADPENQQHKAQLWINNPMTTSVLVTLTQPVPNDIALISAPGAESDGESLSWTMQVEPSSIKAVTFTYAFSGIPGASALLPPAVATLAGLDDSEVLQAASNEAPFHVLWPVAVSYDTPGYVMPGDPLSLVVTVTNRLTQSTTTGTILITGTNQLGELVFGETVAFAVPPGGEVAVFPDPQVALPVGYHVVKGSVIVNGGSSEFMAEVVQVGLPSPEIQFTASTLGPLHPGDRLTYTVRVTNSLDIPITNGVLTASLPISATVDPLSVSDSGVLESNQVKWTLSTIQPESTVVQSFTVVVDANAEPRYSDAPRLLFSEPVLSAAEIVPGYGWGIWNLVAPADGPELHISLHNTPDSGIVAMDPVTYTITLANLGTKDDPAVVVSNTLPPEVRFSHWVTQSPAAMLDGKTLSWIGELQASAEVSITFVVTNLVDGGERVTNTVHFSGTVQAGEAQSGFLTGRHPLIVATVGDGSGVVVGSVAGIDCGFDCVGSYPHGTVVTATATASTGATFAGWSGACSGSGDCVVTMDGAKAVTATFTLNSYACVPARRPFQSWMATSWR